MDARSMQGTAELLRTDHKYDLIGVYKLKSRSAFHLVMATPCSAGYDIASAEDAVLKAGDTRLIDSGLQVALPSNTFAQIIGRTRLACFGILVHPGVIDNDYHDTIKLILHNVSKRDFVIREGDRLAQLIARKFDPVKIVNEQHEESEVLYDSGTPRFQPESATS